MQEEELKPKLRFPEFHGKWDETQINKIGEVVGGGTPDTTKSEFWNGDINWFTPTEVRNKYVTESERKISVTGLKNSSARLLPIGTVLMTSRATIAEPTVTKVVSTTNQGFQSVITNNENSNEFYYYWVLRNKKQFLRKSSGSTFLEISGNNVRNLKIRKPSKAEQQKIASFLSAVDSYIENLKKQKESLEKYKKGMMQKIFSQQIRFKDENGNEFPEWEEKKLNEVCAKYSSNLSANSLPESNGNYKVYGATGYIQNLPYYKQEKPYISIVKDGAGVGRILLCEEKSSVLGTLDVIVPVGNNILEFIYYTFSQINFEKFSTGSTIPHIYFSDYGRVKIKVPVSQEQQKIVQFLSKQDQLIRVKQQQIVRSEQWKKGLLQQLFI